MEQQVIEEGLMWYHTMSAGRLTVWYPILCNASLHVLTASQLLHRCEDSRVNHQRWCSWKSDILHVCWAEGRYSSWEPAGSLCEGQLTVTDTTQKNIKYYNSFLCRSESPGSDCVDSIWSDDGGCWNQLLIADIIVASWCISVCCYRVYTKFCLLDPY